MPLDHQIRHRRTRDHHNPSRPGTNNSLLWEDHAAIQRELMATEEQQQHSDVLYQQAAPDLRRYVRSQLKNIRRGNDVDVEDIVQEAFLRVWSSNNSSGIKNSKGYLFRTARNLIIDIGRRRATQPIDIHTTAEDSHVQAAASIKLTPERYLSAHQDLEIVMQTIDGLPVNCRKAFCLQRSTGKTYAKVAEELNMSESMVQKHMARALIALHKALP